MGYWELRVLNSFCVQVSGNHSKSECQYHSSRPISCHPIKATLHLSAELILSPGHCSPVQGPRVTPQVQFLELFVALGPCHAQGGQLEGSLKGKNRNWIHVSFYPGSGNLSRQHYQLQSGPGTRGVGVLENFIEGTEKFQAPEDKIPGRSLADLSRKSALPSVCFLWHNEWKE